MNCPECGIKEDVTYNVPSGAWIPLMDLPAPQYSCEHYRKACPRCTVCGAPNAPVGQVPVSLPYSDAYCQTPSCVAGMRKLLLPDMLAYLKQMHIRDQQDGFSDSLSSSIADIERELADSP